ncbi:MAG TPA: gluconokinase [Candidatus Methylacidiphilales bacterium]|nr:gluconokinase [Candidatus Methylacidiphilales bacterium]
MILAIDIGTSSSRAAIYDPAGARLPETTSQFAYPLQTGPDGRAELRPADLDRAVRQAVASTLKIWRKKKSPHPIAGIGVSCFWHSLLGLGQDGRPLTSIYTWADSRCHQEAALLRRDPGEAFIHARTGCMSRTSFWPAKLLWLRQTNPRLYAAAERWVSPAEWIQERWCGQASVSLSMASGTGLLSGHTLQWDPVLLRRCHVSSQRLNPLSESPQKLRPKLAKLYPELRDALWFPAIGDGAASNLGSGAVAPGIAAINIGTSAALRVVLQDSPRRKPMAPLGLFAYRVDARRQLLGGAVSNAGNLRAWALRELNLPADSAQLEKLLTARPLPAENLTILPFWMAERAPTWPENLHSIVTGITQATTALDLLQGLQEATYQRLAQIAGLVEEKVERKLTFIVSGGLQRSPNSLQRLANVLGRTVYPSFEPEASLRGSALFALEQLGCKIKHPPPQAAIRPQSAPTRAYARARQRQIALERRSQQVFASSLDWKENYALPTMSRTRSKLPHL